MTLSAAKTSLTQQLNDHLMINSQKRRLQRFGHKLREKLAAADRERRDECCFFKNKNHGRLQKWQTEGNEHEVERKREEDVMVTLYPFGLLRMGVGASNMDISLPFGDVPACVSSKDTGTSWGEWNFDLIEEFDELIFK